MNVKNSGRYGSILIAVSGVTVFFGIFNEFLLAQVMIIPDSIKVFTLLFLSTLSVTLIYRTIERGKKSSDRQEVPDDRKPVEIHTFCSKQRLTYNEFLEFFSKNLSDTIKFTEDNAREFIKKLENLYQESKEQNELIQASVKSGGELLQIIDKQIDHNRETIETLNSWIRQNSENLKQDLEKMMNLQKKVELIVPLMGSIKEISEQINILSINAAIESARVGEKGAGFAVIANEIRKLSNKTEKITGEIIEKISSLSNTMSDYMIFFRGKIEESLEIHEFERVKKSTEFMDREFGKISSIIRELTSKINEQNQIIFQCVTDLLGKVQFQDVVRQRLEKLCEQMKELADYNQRLHCWVENPSETERPPQIRELLDKFYKGYVIQAQRDIHKEVFDGRKAEAKETPKIELF